MTSATPPGRGDFSNNWLRGIRDALRPLTDYQKVMQQALRPMQDALAAIGRQIQETTASISESMRPVVERLERYPHVCAEFGWPPIDAPLSTIIEIVDLYDAKGELARCDVDAIFVRMVSKQSLRDLRVQWGASYLLRRRAHILDSVMRAHFRRDYALTVPVLLASIEGVIADLHVPKGRMTQSRVETLLGEIFASENAPERWSSRLNDTARSVIVDTMVGSFTHGDPLPKEIRRNAVLHGADVGYDTEASSLKAILMLDLVREQYGYVALTDSDVYHRQTCSTLRRSTRAGRHYKTTTSAGRASKRACAICRPDEAQQ